jgi:hypothetical protein
MILQWPKNLGMPHDFVFTQVFGAVHMTVRLQHVLGRELL